MLILILVHKTNDVWLQVNTEPIGVQKGCVELHEGYDGTIINNCPKILAETDLSLNLVPVYNYKYEVGSKIVLKFCVISVTLTQHHHNTLCKG